MQGNRADENKCNGGKEQDGNPSKTILFHTSSMRKKEDKYVKYAAQMRSAVRSFNHEEYYFNGR